MPMPLRTWSIGSAATEGIPEEKLRVFLAHENDLHGIRTCLFQEALKLVGEKTPVVVTVAIRYHCGLKRQNSVYNRSASTKEAKLPKELSSSSRISFVIICKSNHLQLSDAANL
jgi:hypothetical protein